MHQSARHVKSTLVARFRFHPLHLQRIEAKSSDECRRDVPTDASAISQHDTDDMSDSKNTYTTYTTTISLHNFQKKNHELTTPSIVTQVV